MKEPRSLLQRRTEQVALLLVLPSLAFVLLIKAYPLGMAILNSFTNWNGLNRHDFVGLRNYVNLLTGTEFWTLLRNTLVLLLYVPFQIAGGLIVSVLLYEETPGWRFFRTVYYLPQVLSTVVIGFLFTILFGFAGPVNRILILIGLSEKPVEWLADARTSIPIIILCLVWINVGWQTLIFSGGLSAISPSVLEAARIDGAGYWRTLFRVTLPMLMRTVEYSLIVSVIWVFTGIFPIIFSMTKGGPGRSTTTIDYMIYVKAFVSGNQLGVACALAMILTVIVLFVTRLQMIATDKLDDWGD